MASLFVYPSATPVASGNSYASSKLYFYRPGTTTLITVYSTSALDPAAVLTNPVVASATGVFAPIYINEAVNESYRMIHKTSAGATISDKDNIPASSPYLAGDVRRYGALGDNSTDNTAAFVAALAANSEIYIPAGTWKTDTISVTNAGTRIRTDGFDTVIQQNSGTAAGTRLIVIAASDVTLDTLTVKGNISTDTGEQHHGVFVYKTGGSIQNITVGDIYGENLRGDVLYLGAPSGYTTTHVRFGRIVGKNVLRNVVSIVGGSYIDGVAAVSDTSTGLWALDIEPDAVTSHDIAVGYVKGAAMACVPPLAANSAYNIHIGMADLNPAYATDTTPTYASRDVSSALFLRNIKSFRIDHLRVRDHTDFAVEYIWNGGEQRGESIEIGYLDADNVGGSESTYNTLMQFQTVNNFALHGALVVHDAVGDSIVLGDTSGSTFTRGTMRNISCDGRVARYLKDSIISGVAVNTANATSAFLNCYDCTIQNSTLTIPTLLSYCARTTLLNVTATCSTAYYSNCNDTVRLNSDLGGNQAPFGSTRAAEAGQTGELVLGSATQTTVGAAGGGSALPATPTGYIKAYIGTTAYVIPYYAQA